MKKGCLLSIAVITVLIGVAFYILKTYGDEIVYYAKKELVSISVNNMLEGVYTGEGEIYADSIKADLEHLVETLDFENFEAEFDKLDNLIKNSSDILKGDGMIEEKYQEIKKLIERYEKTEKN